ncbi:putative ABC transport system permease protein [Pseudoxanthomonas sp. GM95]|uniref:ABC transporter permease n=1 Tax=Pseudoxanthomonas sp. GM95 TaxID=1881043 RepID=UPI0008BB2259|nr:ABC transporter permease [Pseudoxanthomonas sp. GM95]SEL45416.1 putative ABC transport system permease protein [Pseudoxanthomonas sp. GM95]
MFAYYCNLALRSFGRNKVLTALMVLAIALGIGASMTTLTVFHVLSGDPIPQKSERLFHVQVDPEMLAGYTPGDEPQSDISRYDGETLLQQKQAKRQVLMTGGSITVEPAGGALKPFMLDGRYTTPDFFTMFDVPFLFGRAWSASDDDGQARVVVIAKVLNDKLFNGADSTGKTLRIDGHDFQIVGVIDDWAPKPLFYDLNVGTYNTDEQVFEPFQTAIGLGQSRSGSMNCYGPEATIDGTARGAPCAFAQYWVELDSASKADDFKAYLDRYSQQQHESGRFQRPPNTRLRNVMDWLDYNGAVPGDVRLQLWLAMGFLLVCLVNTVGLLLAKFLRRSGEIGVRRALGASRTEIFKQCLVEAGSIGLAGGVLGLGLAELGLWAVRHRPTGYAALAQLDLSMLLMTFVLAVCASLVAGLLPAWRAMQITPAVQLKTQ